MSPKQFKKEKITKEDGRYVIFYTFEEESEDQGPESTDVRPETSDQRPQTNTQSTMRLWSTLTAYGLRPTAFPDMQLATRNPQRRE